MNVLAFPPTQHPPTEHPRGIIVEFPLTRVIFDDTMRPVNPVAALCGVCVAWFGTMLVAVVVTLVLLTR